MKRMLFAVVALIGATGCPDKTEIKFSDDSIAAPRAAHTPAPQPVTTAAQPAKQEFRRVLRDSVRGAKKGHQQVPQYLVDGSRWCEKRGDKVVCEDETGYDNLATTSQLVPAPTTASAPASELAADDKLKARKPRRKKAVTTGSTDDELKAAQDAKAKAEADLAACIADREACKKETSVLRKEVDDLKAWRAKVEKEGGAGTKAIVKPPSAPLKGPGTRKPGTVHRIKVAPPGGAK